MPMCPKGLACDWRESSILHRKIATLLLSLAETTSIPVATGLAGNPSVQAIDDRRTNCVANNKATRILK